MRVVKVGSRGVGARIEGLDLREPLSAEQLQALLRTFHERAVVCIPGQRLSAAEQCAFTRQLGDLLVHPAGHGRHPDPACPRNRFDDMSLVLHLNGRGRNDRWHTEISGMATPPRYTVLHQHQSPGQGKGNTLFADMRAAFASLSPAMQNTLTAMDAVHGFYNYVTPQPERETQQAVWDPARLIDRRTGDLLPLEVAHPLVRAHDRVRTLALYISDPRDSFGSRFRGWTREESLPLWDYLMEVATRENNIFTHHWSQGDVLLWDNQSVMHYAVKDYDGDLEPRISTRTTVVGDLPVGVDGRRSVSFQDREWDWDALQRDAVVGDAAMHEDVLNTVGWTRELGKL